MLAARHKRRITLKTVAEYVGVKATSQVSRWERGVVPIPNHHRARLNALLGIELEIKG